MRLFARVPSVDPKEAASLVARREAVVLDVRQTGEWTRGHIQHAIHIPLGQLSDRLDELPTGKTIITACLSGHRSASAARKLARAGHDVLNLRGGLTAWRRDGFPFSADRRRRR